jgi:recombinase
MSTQDPTISKRSQALRRRHRESGDKSYLLWLSPTAQARLARLKREGETLAQLVDRALETLEGVAQSVANQRETVAKTVAERTQEDRQRLEVWVPDDLVDSLRAFLLGGVVQSVAQQREGVANSVAEQREGVANLVAQQRVANSVAKQRLIAQAAELRAQGLSWEEIARRWNAEGVPTLSGKGQWHRKTITRLVGNE